MLLEFVYLIPFLNHKYFKIGKSSVSNLRLLTHNKKYNINFEKSKIIFPIKNQISHAFLLESELLMICPLLNIEEFHLTQLNWSLEIRDIKYFKRTIEHTKFKSHSPYFKYLIFDYFEVFDTSNKLQDLQNFNKKINYAKK